MTLVDFLIAIEALVLVFFAIIAVSQAMLMASAGLELRALLRQRGFGRTRDVLGSPFAPSVSILAPAYNEEAMIADTIESMLTMEYPSLEVVVVNDGSDDDTLEVLRNRFDLVEIPIVCASALEFESLRAIYQSRTHPQLRVVDKMNGGKADSLNAGLSHATGQLVCAVDADTIIEPDAISRLVERFRQDPGIVAAGGSVRPVNGCRVHLGRVVERRLPTGPLASIQRVEYARAFLFGRLGWNRLGGNVIISGAFGLFDRRAVIEVGGYLESTVGEDMELVVRLRRQALTRQEPGRVSFRAEPMAWTEVPESVTSLARQRNRWHRGLSDVLWRHRDMIGRRRYGPVGTVVLPFYVLELVSPLVELIGLVTTLLALSLGAIDAQIAAAYFLLAHGFGFGISAVALGFEDRLDEEHLRTGRQPGRLAWMVLEEVGYRQATLLWRIWGVIAWIKGDRHWGTQARAGLNTSRDVPDGDQERSVAASPRGS